MYSRAKDSAAGVMDRVEQAIAEAAATVRSSMSDPMPLHNDPHHESHQSFLGDSVDRIKRAVGAEPAAEATEESKSLLQKARDWTTGASKTAQGAAQDALDETKKTASQLGEKVSDASQQARDKASEASQHIREFGNEVIGHNVNQPAVSNSAPQADSILSRTKRWLTGAEQQVQETADDASDAAKQKAEDVKENADSLLNRAKGWLYSSKQSAQDQTGKVKDTADSAIETGKSWLADTKDSAAETAQNVKDALTGASDETRRAAAEKAEELEKGSKSFLQKAKSWVTGSKESGNVMYIFIF